MTSTIASARCGSIGPPGLIELFKALRRIFGRIGYEVELVELGPGEAVRHDGYEVRPFEVEHRMRAYGYALVEDERPGRFDPEEAERLGVPPGPAFSRLQDGETGRGQRRVGRPEQVMGEPRAGRKLVISGDTAPCEMTRVAAHEAQVLVHDASFADAESERAARDRPLNGPPGGRARRRRRGRAARTRPYLLALRRPRGARRGAGRNSRARSRRATSTWSRSRSPSAASRAWSRTAPATPGPARGRPEPRAMTLDERLARHLHVESLRHRDLHPEHEPHVLFQASTIGALLDGRLRRRRHLRGARRARRPRARDAERARRRDDRGRRALLSRRRRRRRRGGRPQ